MRKPWIARLAIPRSDVIAVDQIIGEESLNRSKPHELAHGIESGLLRAGADLARGLSPALPSLFPPDAIKKQFD